MFHPLTWAGWLVAALVALSTTRNPLHLVLIMLCIAIVNVTSTSDETAAYYPVSPLRFTLTVILLAALFNAVTAHFGDTILFRLPKGLPVVGGAITLEALVYGSLNGMVLAGILTSQPRR